MSHVLCNSSFGSNSTQSRWDVAADTFWRLTNLITIWRRRARDRADLARMADRDIRDAGLDRSQIVFEINKPFWRA